MCISHKSINSQWYNPAQFTVLQSPPITVLYTNTKLHFHTQNFTSIALDSSDNAGRNSLSGRKHVHDAAITVFQVKSSIMKSKPTMSSTDIQAITNYEKLKCQGIVSFHYNQKAPSIDYIFGWLGAIHKPSNSW